MLSFYQKLASKLNDGGSSGGSEDPRSAAPAQAPAAGGRNTAPLPNQQPAAEEPAPEGTEALDVDLYQSDSRMVVFIQMSGVSADDFEITADEELNTLTVQATQKRPDVPARTVPEGAEAEKGRFVKQEVKWKALYRKIYLPASFKGGDAEAYLQRGVLVVTLPVKHPGIGKKLAVREIFDEKKA